MTTTQKIEWSDFSKIEMRVGTITHAEVFKEAKKAAYKLIVDFGEHGSRKTSAQLVKLYSIEDVIGKQVIAVLNFPPKQIANFFSECLILGSIGEDGEVTLLTIDKKVKNGEPIG